MSLVSLLGGKLVSKMGDVPEKDETVATEEALKGKKQIALYFSAHWCPPCRGFTPKLAETYKAMKAAEKDFEIVFISSDRDRDACKSYHGEQPWLCLPYEDRDRKAALSKKFKVQGIPSLVILDGEGKLVSAKGRSFVSNDPRGEEFPWVPPTVKSLLGASVLSKDGEVATSSFTGKHIALYFSAHWCPPCKGFTPKLAATYKAMRASPETANNFEFIFVSSDNAQAAFDEYFAEMPWCALPYSNRKAKEQLSDMFEVRGIPSLVVLDWDSGKVINKAARGACEGDPEGKEFPWFPKPVNDVNQVTDGLNDETCVIALLDGATPEEQVARKNDLDMVAKAHYDAAKAAGSEPKYRFFFETAKGQISTQIRRLCSVGDGGKTIVLDLGAGGSYYDAAKECDVKQLLSDFEAKKLEKKQVKQ